MATTTSSTLAQEQQPAPPPLPLSPSPPSTTASSSTSSSSTTRFTLELEFVTSLSNPTYLAHLATLTATPTSTSSTTTTTRPTPLLSSPLFQSYLKYLLTYWSRPEYAQYLPYPGPTLRNLRLLQEEAFRAVALRPDVVDALAAVTTTTTAMTTTTLPPTTAPTTDGGPETQNPNQNQKDRDVNGGPTVNDDDDDRDDARSRGAAPATSVREDLLITRKNSSDVWNVVGQNQKGKEREKKMDGDVDVEMMTN